MCGLAGILSITDKQEITSLADAEALNNIVTEIEQNDIIDDSLWQTVQSLKREANFIEIYKNKELQDNISELARRISDITEEKTKLDNISPEIEKLKDIEWCLTKEIQNNIEKVRELAKGDEQGAVRIFRDINAVLNSIDRLEVRGRDSAGITLMFVLEKPEFEKFRQTLDNENLLKESEERSGKDVLLNRGISINGTAIAFTYKIAAEIGSLGDNTAFLRDQIKNDPVLHILAGFSHKYHTVSSHTRWASVGAITEPNCHPVDSKTRDNNANAIIHVCLNGDIDNYLELKQEYEPGSLIHEDITTDTKIIPLQIEKYFEQGFDVEESFRLAVNSFHGSHAICMQTDLVPGKIFLAQKGSGQAIFVGLAEDHYMSASEVYGFVEETPYYLKMDGEKTFEGKNGRTQGQIFVLDQESAGGLDGIRAMFYDGTPVALGQEDIQHTKITSRDIDRQDFPHYFLKEISEAPGSVEKTLHNRWKTDHGIHGIQERLQISLDEKIFPESLKKALADDQIRRVFFIGQGTAGVAAQACASVLNYYMDDPSIFISSMKASEMSGFNLRGEDAEAMSDTLIVAISQSGTTTDTNRTVDMVKERGAHTLAIVNRRDSDITFKVDGVMYTSSGRDVEMSVASTKAFYSQIIAGAVLGLNMASLKGRRGHEFVTQEIRQMLELPSHMRKVLSIKDKIEESAKRTATTRTYWAAVGSGPNKASADEIRIKLSELCYKTISSDFVEDKKHIDLSSEPLIIVCAAGTRDTVISDIIKDTAIFHAHKALAVIIADQDEHRFDPYAEDVFYVPAVSEHFAPVLNTLVGHIWGYYAALAINDGSRFLYNFREDIRTAIEDCAKEGLDVYELALDERFREKIAFFYKEFKSKRDENRLPTSMGFAASSDLTLLLKYLAGRLPASDFELDFSIKGTALNMLNKLFECLGKSINGMARPVDAIKHQAKTVTVGTSRISAKAEGLLFEKLRAYNFKVSQLVTENVIVLKNLQAIVSGIDGAILYRVEGLNLLGKPTDETTISVLKKEGMAAEVPSRVESDHILQGTKQIIVRRGNVYIGKGRKDDRSILVIPLISDSPSRPNMIEYLLLLDISFAENVPLEAKIKALGGKYHHLRDIVRENSIAWDDKFLDQVETEELFGRSAEKIGEYIVSRLN